MKAALDTSTPWKIKTKIAPASIFSPVIVLRSHFEVLQREDWPCQSLLVGFIVSLARGT